MNTYTIISKGCSLSAKIEKNILNNIKLIKEDTNPNIVIVIGGDGTILRAIHKYSNIIEDITIFGIHTGHLGFLANYEVSDVDNLINILNNNLEYKIEDQMLIDYEFQSNKGVTTGIALNEVSITAAPNMIVLDVLVNNEKLETFRGGGLCIATPIGSTGYNKSLGGAVIDHNIKCLQVTEIAGINSNSYKTLMSPLLLSSNREVSITGNNEYALFTNDNNSMIVDNFNNLKIKVSNKSVKFAYSNGINFIKRVNKSFL